MSDKLVSHNVYFALTDASEKAVQTLIADCHTYLRPIPGIVYFSVGSILEEHQRDVNVRNFHVGIHVTFADKAAHDAYQACDLHNEFVDRNKDNWKDVKVYDMYADYS